MKYLNYFEADVLVGLDLLVVYGVGLAFAEQLKSLGVGMDPALLFEKQVGIVGKSAFCSQGLSLLTGKV